MSKQEIISLLETKAGITNANCLSDTDFMLLRMGQMCESLLLTNFNKFIPEKLQGKVDNKLCKVKLNFVSSIGQVRPTIVRKYNELKIPESYMGYQFSLEEIKQLLNGGRLNSTVNIEYEDIKSTGIIAVDKELNLIKFLPLDKIGIPESIGKNKLTQENIGALRKGFPVFFPEFERNDGKKFGAIIEFNNDGVLKGKFAISGLSQWLEEQKKQVERNSKIMDMQLGILDQKIKIKSLKSRL
jgi:hypothetical protein